MTGYRYALLLISGKLMGRMSGVFLHTDGFKRMINPFPYFRRRYTEVFGTESDILLYD